jgi:predicted TIM-barrel fold metal-dependent hydrolase
LGLWELIVVTRRVLLGYGATLSACTPWAPDAGAELSEIIDAHTHVFNASDLSVRGFINIVYCKNYETADPDCGAGKPYGPLAADILKGIADTFAPSAAKEARKLSGRPFADALDEDSFDLADNPSRDEEALDVFKSAFVDRLSVAAEGPGPLVDQSDALLNQIDLESAALAPNLAPAGGSLRAKIDALMNEESKGDISQLLKWMAWMCRSRNRIILRHKELYSTAATPVRRLVGLMVDFEHWLHDAPKSHFPDQLNVMAKLRQRHPELIIFAPFDPLREVLARLDGATSPLADLQQRWETYIDGRRAIEGVKIYPPMGFKAIDNAATPMGAFPRGVIAAWQSRGGTGHLGEKLDEVLEAFYRWAQAKDVPIMAHAGNSEGAGCKFGELASAEHWLKVLDTAPRADARPGLNLRNLRLCLGHFENDEKDFVSNDHSWGHQKGPLLDFPNVYTDLSFMQDVLDPGHDAAMAKFFSELKKFTDGPRQAKLLYGSDWIMLGRISHHRQYFARLLAGLEAGGFSPESRRAFASENAKRFLAR